MMEERKFQMLGDFDNKKYPSVTIQGVILAASILYLKHEGPGFLVVISILIVLSLFFLQALNHRFYYYFPANKFTGTSTPDIDTYILYGMTFIAIMFFIWGISECFLLAAFSSILILASGIGWRKFMYKRIRERITIKLKRDKYIHNIECPKCGALAIRVRTVLAWNEGNEVIECLDGCKAKIEKKVPLNIG